ncbi:MAG: hypothetical protein QM758_21810 [Armatimonas sp.]
MLLNRKEDILHFTRSYTGERFANGRPRVSDDILQRMKLVTVEEAWGVCKSHGYTHQYEGGWWNVHPDRVLVGRAVTARYVHTRPDLHEALADWGRENHAVGLHNSWVIDTLEENDTIVVDLFGKIKEGTFAGDNLGTAIANRTKTGMVIHGGIRDIARLQEIPDIAIFARGQDASGIAEVTLEGMNCPITIGDATVLPGDVVLGTVAGVVFIPAHLAEEVVVKSELIRKQDEWGQLRIREGQYSSGEVDGAWTEAMKEDFARWQESQS